MTDGQKLYKREIDDTGWYDVTFETSRDVFAE